MSHKRADSQIQVNWQSTKCVEREGEKDVKISFGSTAAAIVVMALLFMIIARNMMVMLFESIVEWSITCEPQQNWVSESAFDVIIPNDKREREGYLNTHYYSELLLNEHDRE